MFHVEQGLSFDVIVVGGGHAGCEAAAAAARRGCRVGLVTLSAADLGVMSCNPAFGGLGKGHLVREIDALGGLMGAAADEAAIHYRLLNRRKGPAVQGPRVQADRRLYARAVQRRIKAETNITIIEGQVTDLRLERRQVEGVVLIDGRVLETQAVVLTTGTFLNSLMHCGEVRTVGGRVGAPASLPLAARLKELGLRCARLKTGTPPRLDGRTVDWTRVDWQPTDAEPSFLSASTQHVQAPQIACGIVRTTDRTHAIIRNGLTRSPLFNGQIEGRGPRYCPSIEDKIVRFGDRDGHQIFLEPEGLDSVSIYPNGISTSLPLDIQQAMIASIAGLERTTILQPGYAVEYDHLDPRQLDARLALSALEGVFAAGQINGTTGYEEAGAQGLIAGANAAALVQGRKPLILDRADAYIGVMIDDLVTQGVSEPYRMFTSRAEYRLHLRADNAEARLGTLASDHGLLGKDQRAARARRDAWRQQLARRLDDRLPRAVLTADPAIADERSRTGWEWLRLPGMTIAGLGIDTTGFPAAIVSEIENDAIYAHYVERQRQEVEAMRAEAGLRLPTELDYDAVPGLSLEMRERLSLVAPTTLGQAARVPGVTPACLAALLTYARRAA